MKPTRTILGFSGWFHDSSACLLKDGNVVAFVEEERFDRRKHTPEYPKNSIDYCLQAGGIGLDEVDAAVFYINPAILLKSNISHLLKYLPGSLNLFRKGVTVVPVKDRYLNLFRLRSIMKQHHAKKPTTLMLLPHYKTHQAAAFFCSPFEEAAIITLDMAVDGVSQTIGMGKGQKIKTLVEHRFPHGWGIIYSLFSHFVGFRFYDEYKVMGMAAYGEPRYVDFIENNLYFFNDDTGGFRLNLDFFSFQHSGMLKIWSDRLLREIGPPRESGRPLDQRDYDWAASVQLATERFGVRLARFAQRITGCANLTLAGGVVQNCLMNQKIMESNIFKAVFAQPLASDVGGALGAALYYEHHVLGQPRRFVLEHLYWGPSYQDDYEASLQRNGLHYRRNDNPAQEIAKAIADGLVVGFFCGRMEAGPRALGARSILADPRRKDMKDILNMRVKHREHFRPFAPSCLAEQMDMVFRPISASRSSAYMITTFDVRPEWRDRIPTVTHHDGTSRPQAVRREDNPLFWDIINEFYSLTGVPLIVNTSFNDNEPIVCTPQDAINCFSRTKIDLLAFEHLLVYQKDNL